MDRPARLRLLPGRQGLRQQTPTGRGSRNRACRAMLTGDERVLMGVAVNDPGPASRLCVIGLSRGQAGAGPKAPARHHARRPGRSYAEAG